VGGEPFAESLDRLARLLDQDAAARRETLIEVARSVYLDPEFEPSEAAARVMDGVRAHSTVARERAEEELEALELTAREAERRARRAQFGAEREELLAVLEELAAWYRDLVAVAAGARDAVIHFDRLAELEEDATRERMLGAEEAADAVRELWRRYEEFNLNPSLALEALFVRLSRALS